MGNFLQYADSLPAAAQTVAYYSGLMTSEYKTSPNMLAWLAANAQLFLDMVACANSIPPAFDIDLAVGTQLDIIGELAGVSRTVPFQPNNSISPILDDATYRLLIRATCMRNHWDGKIASLISIWRQLLPGGLIFIYDQQNMTVNFYIGVSLTSIIKDLIANGFVLPRSEGVLYNITFAELPMFGVDEDNAYIAGIDVGKFV
jgi:hypothetical protein